MVEDLQKNCIPEKYDIVTINEENIDLLDVFWRKIEDKYPVLLIRDASFMRWRYLEMPRKNYDIKMISEDGNLLGIVVSRVTNVGKMKCGMIVDFIIEKGQLKAGQCLIQHVINQFRAQKIGLSGCLMQRHVEEAKILKKEGFFVCPKALEPQPFPIILRKFNNNQDILKVNDFKNWFFTMGDYDAI